MKRVCRIRVGRHGVDLRLTRQGVKALDFPPILLLVFPQGLRGVQKAIRVFKRMMDHECGRAVEVV